GGAERAAQPGTAGAPRRAPGRGGPARFLRPPRRRRGGSRRAVLEAGGQGVTQRGATPRGTTRRGRSAPGRAVTFTRRDSLGRRRPQPNIETAHPAPERN